ncbi:hypothetical protein [Cystobacter fuscus]|uniref:hypothetical protein n=1 Tax=Cystobacter fuscus TaxID=43 RepID=UPI002B324EFA|nr:hypothetical protein F0U63_21415 [Cystobacter fuscus]
MSRTLTDGLIGLFFVKDKLGGFLVHVYVDGTWGEVVGVDAWEKSAQAECIQSGRVFEGEAALRAYVAEMMRRESGA